MRRYIANVRQCFPTVALLSPLLLALGCGEAARTSTQQTVTETPAARSGEWLYAEPPTPRKLSPQEFARLKAGLETSMREWHRGFSSKAEEDQLRTLRQMSPSKAEIETLFPNHADRLLPLFEQGEQRWARQIGAFAARYVEGGEIKSIRVEDTRREPNHAKRYAELFRMIPAEVEVFRVSVEKPTVSEGGVTVVYVNNRWVWIKDVYAIPELLRELGK